MGAVLDAFVIGALSAVIGICMLWTAKEAGKRVAEVRRKK